MDPTVAHPTDSFGRLITPVLFEMQGVIHQRQIRLASDESGGGQGYQLMAPLLV